MGLKGNHLEREVEMAIVYVDYVNLYSAIRNVGAP